MDYASSKEIAQFSSTTRQAVEKMVKDKKIEYILKKVDGSTKPIKYYKLIDLPENYLTKLKVQGIEIEEEKPTNISQANFTNVYLLASPAKQKVAVLKCRLVEFYLKRDTSLNQAKWLEKTLQNSLEFDELGSVSPKQLNDWLAKYKEAKAKATNVVEAFIDARGAKRGVKALSDEQKVVAERYFVKTSRPMMSEVYRNMCHDFGDTMPSYDVLNSYYKEWQIKNPLLYLFSKSPDDYKNKYQPAYGNESEKAKYKNHYWELDSTPADVICEDGKRYAVIAAIDVYSRRVVFHVAESSSSYTISQLLRKTIIKWGIPENVVIDNGKDYTSNHFESICVNLGVNMLIVPPFSGECKPHVERVFGTLSRELFEQVPGYIGHNVAQRAELQARKSFAHKIQSQEKWREEQRLKTDDEKKAWRDGWKLKKENLGLELNILLSADELQSWCDRWADKLYEQREHSSLKTSPINKWNKNLSPVQTVPDVRMLDMLLGESAIRKVGKKGIAFSGCNYAHIELIEHTGKSVFVMAPDDMGYILVYDEKMKFICIAEDLEHTGQSRHVAKKAKAKHLAMSRQLDKIVKEAQSINDTSIMDRIEAVSDAVPSQTFAVTKHTEMVTALLDSSKEIEAQDTKALEESNHYDFTKKDDEGLLVKVLPNGRPAFKSFYDRFLWVLENDDWNEKDKKLKEKNLEVYEMAHNEYLRRQSS